jgi:TrpR family trp operon transcriptional repressor
MNEKKLLKKGWRKYIQLIKHSDNLNELFKLLLTEEERNGFAKRALIFEALLKGEKTQREISKELKVSISKITRGSNELKTTNETLKKFLRTIFYENKHEY